MKVNLVKVAEYELKSENCANVPLSSFLNMVDMEDRTGIYENLPKVRIFSGVGEFLNISRAELEELDEERGVLIMKNGNFCIFLKEESKDGSANTEENTEE